MNQIDLPRRLLLVPFFPQARFPLPGRPHRRFQRLHAEFLAFPDFAMIHGFIGYSHLLALLAGIKDVREKEFFFLGTAGAIDVNIGAPVCLNIAEVFASSIFRRFSRNSSLPLQLINPSPYASATAVSVDILQRETPLWLTRQRLRRISVVEMELFPLRVFLRKSFFAMVVVTDRVTGSGIEPFRARSEIRELHLQAFQFMMRWVNETQCHSHS